jgi:hypothetical protein
VIVLPIGQPYVAVGSGRCQSENGINNLAIKPLKTTQIGERCTSAWSTVSANCAVAKSRIWNQGEVSLVLSQQ